MNVAIIGTSYKIAEASIREKMAFSNTQKVQAMETLASLGIAEISILSTCNRTEIYFTYNNLDIDTNIVLNYLKEYSLLENLEQYIYIKTNEEALKHIFSVSCGLESMVLGEDEILGQVKLDSTLSMENKFSKKILNKLFREAITTAKRLKTEFKISENPLSTSYIGVKLLQQYLGTLKDKTALIIGVGQIGTLCLNYLKDEGLANIYVTNRTHSKSLELQEVNKDLKVIEYTKKQEYYDEVDFIICSTSAPHLVIRKEELLNVNKDLFILDLAIPRDVEDSVKELEHVHLFNIDDLERISHSNEDKRKEVASKMEVEILIQIEKLIGWFKLTLFDNVFKRINDYEVFNHIEELTKIKELNDISDDHFARILKNYNQIIQSQEKWVA